MADASPIPVIVYQAPLRMSTLDFPTGLVAELSNHENIVGIKDSRGKLDLVGELVEQCQDGFQVLVGSGALLYPALEVGAVGGIVAVGQHGPGGLRRPLPGIHLRDEARRQAASSSRIGPVHNDIVGAIGVAGVSRQPWTFWGTEEGIPVHPSSPHRRKPEGKSGKLWYEVAS